MGRTPPSRVNLKRILDHLRVASRKGDRAALTLAVDQMKTLALSPPYWERYLGLLRNPLARLVDLLVIKQGERIAHQKGWTLGAGHRPPSGGRRAVEARPSLPPSSPGLRGQSPRSKRRDSRRSRSGPVADQPSLFD